MAARMVVVMLAEMSEALVAVAARAVLWAAMALAVGAGRVAEAT